MKITSKKINSFVPGLLLLFNTILFSQPTTDQDYKDALSFFKSGYYQNAYKLLVKVNQKYPEDQHVLSFIGQIQVEQRQWADAKDWFEKLNKLNKENLFAQYYLGICYRETGRFKALLLQKRDWNKSRAWFEAVFLKDPKYKDVFYQYSILQRYRGEYFFAVDRAERQLAYKPNIANTTVGAHQNYDFMLFHENKDKVREWLRGRKEPRALLYLGESFRRESEWEKADSVLSDLTIHPRPGLSPIPVQLAMARLKYQQEKYDECEKWFFQAIDSIKTIKDAELLLEDVKYVMSDGEYNAYLDSYRVNDKKKFFRKFWLQRNPMPGSAHNLRLVEHYRRLLYCEEHFRFDGVRSWVNSPDKQRYLRYPRVFFLNEKFNDKGLIYIRHGEPDERAVDVAGKYGAMPAAPGEEATSSNESWLYYAGVRPQKLIFHFLISENATGNNWQLAPILPPNMLEGRLEWDSMYHRMFAAENEGDVAELTSLQIQMGNQAQSDVFYALTHDVQSWYQPIQSISFPFYVSTFRGEGNKTRYEIYYGLDSSQLWPTEEDFVPENEIELGFAAYDSEWNELFRENKTLSHQLVKSTMDSLKKWVDQYVFEIVPCELNMNLFLRMPERNGIGGFKFKFGHAIYSNKNLKMSAITLADKIEPSQQRGKYIKNGLKILPNPQRLFDKLNPVNTYFEIYNLPITGNAQVKFEIEYKIKLLKKDNQSLFERLKGIFSRSSGEISNKVERFSSEEKSIEYLALDLSKQDAGQYELEITVTDVNNETTNNKIKFNLK